MNTHNHNVYLQLYFLWHALRSCSLAALTSKHSLEVISFFPDLQLTAIIILKWVLIWEVGGIRRLGQKAVSGVIWDPGFGSFPSDLGQSTSAAQCLCSFNLIRYNSFQSNWLIFVLVSSSEATPKSPNVCAWNWSLNIKSPSLLPALYLG